MNEQDFVRFITIKKGLSANSIRTCRIRFGIITKWLAENNKELTKETVEEFFYYLKQRGLNNNTLKMYCHEKDTLDMIAEIDLVIQEVFYLL